MDAPAEFKPSNTLGTIRKTKGVTEKIRSELLTPREGGLLRRGKDARWDPHSRFNYDEEEVSRFYSGYPMRQMTGLRDQEAFAKFAIEKVLSELPKQSIQITGQAMQSESVTLNMDYSRELRELIHDVQAEGHHDVNNEVTTTSRDAKDHDNEIVQIVGATAEAIISASVNSLGPPVKACAAYLKMKQCDTHGRNHLPIWRSPLFPSLDREEDRKGLLDTQITAICWILSRMFGRLPKLRFRDPDTGESRHNLETAQEREHRDKLRGPKYFGGLLADSMGLGKTLTTVALMNLLVSQNLNVRPGVDGKDKYYPMLLLVPNVPVAIQWVDQIEEVIDNYTIRHIVVSGNGLPRVEKGQRRTVLLDAREFDSWPPGLDYMWNENDSRAARTIIIMPIDTWAGRTCEREADGKFSSSFTQLGRKFSLVVVDEAHRVKNINTRNWKSVANLDRQFTLLITATPCINTLTDLIGAAMLLWKVPKQHLIDSGLWSSVEHEFRSLEDLKRLDSLELWEDRWLVAGNPAILAKVLAKGKGNGNHDIEKTRKYLKYFESLAILRRSPGSHLPSGWGRRTSHVSLEGLFPAVENYTVNIQPSDDFDLEYQEAHVDILLDYMKGVTEWGLHTGRRSSKVKKQEDEDYTRGLTTCRRLFQIAASSMDMYRLNRLLTINDFGTLSTHVGVMRQQGVNFVRLAQFIVQPGEREPKTCVEFLNLAVKRSPVLQYILRYIAEKIISRQGSEPIRKLLIIENVPMLAFFYELVLELLGFNCQTLHSDLPNDQRKELIDSFNSNAKESCQIMIQMYTVGFAGTNLHQNCHRVLVAAQAHSLPVQWQAIHRVIRVGQTRDVSVHRIKVNNSYHSYIESRQVEKMLPELGSRARNPMKDVMVRLLNLFQSEVDEAWQSRRGQMLSKEKRLVSNKASDIAEYKRYEEPAKKRIKLKQETGARVKSEDTSGDESESQSEQSSNNSSDDELPDLAYLAAESLKRKRHAKILKKELGHAGWAVESDDMSTHEEVFFALKTRGEYFEEFKGLPRNAKSFFDHSLNDLRRLMSYGRPNRSNISRRWAVKDLDDTAVLERALELMLRIRLGTGNIPMLPHPQIDFSRAPTEKRAALFKMLAECTRTGHDFETAMESKPTKSKEAFKGIDCAEASFNEIAEALDKEAGCSSIVSTVRAPEKNCQPELPSYAPSPPKGGVKKKESDDEFEISDISTIPLLPTGKESDDDDDDCDDIEFLYCRKISR
ncbi:P-loop containing nucleoside triphosphate hydrolase protein [Xylariaceae sp. FL0016]|nr:P-loop containing nucleoside triphosphate hydrolase protein [Xylariaceae sp. FL0016]